MKNEYILVTGGAGYIGSVAVRILLEEGYTVVILDNLSRGTVKNIPPKAVFVKGNIGDRKIVRSVLKKYNVTAIMHFAGYISVAESVRYPGKYRKNNYERSKIFLRTIFDHGIRVFIFSSSAAVYGRPEIIPLTENSPLQPVNPYGKSKLDFEKELYAYSKRGLRYAALRYFNAAGSFLDIREDHVPETHLIPLILRSNKKKPVKIFGTDYKTPDGTCVRDYVHVADIAHAHVKVLKDLMKNKKVPKNLKSSKNPIHLAENAFNVGLGRGYSILEVIKNVEEVFKVKIPMEMAAKRPGDPAILVASPKKLLKLGWRPKYKDLRDIL